MMGLHLSVQAPALSLLCCSELCLVLLPHKPIMNAVECEQARDYLPDTQNPPSPPCIRVPKKEPRFSNTALIFDWDDTLLSSTVLNQNGITLDTDDSLISDQLKAEFLVLEKHVTKMLTAALELGSVFIITNAEHGWVELSCKKFLPGVLSMLDSIPILSARTTYEHRFSTPQEWKTQAFADQVRAIFPNGENMNVISFGDSESERSALLSLSKMAFFRGHSKSVKFVDRPSLEQLRRQLEMITSNIHSLCKHEGSLDLMLTIFTPQQEARNKGY
eukprot:gnl/Trimastix_PCT/307.p1 GENE.gnl/Trimastix_PCT/307~~gnl/Trimastix_PCT/307.p1  ORF type:complete len:275 (+),score=45.10 gnl/Trimastix_PCT/307:36-860(+)